MKMEFNETADKFAAEGRWSEARTVLENAIRAVPVGWKPVSENSESVRIAFWDEDEFLTYTEAAQTEKNVVWVGESYSKAWYRLADIAVEEQRLDNALLCVESGLTLEPDHPGLWIEKGYILNRFRRHDEALYCYEKAATIRDWATTAQVTRAWRGQGAALIDLSRLDDAEAAFRRSLELEPNNETAEHELEYIRQQKQDTTNEQPIPWFLHTFINPPTNPLTIELSVLVEDLEPVPGPRTVGSENYSNIAHAFITRGWAGFEEAFDQIVSRTRPHYADVKRELLREPIFNRKVHRRMQRIITGSATIDDILDEVRRKNDSTKSC
jgi:tetratricopeptide (TPR) repeat protein